jgi:hypothetical protein
MLPNIAKLLARRRGLRRIVTIFLLTLGVNRTDLDAQQIVGAPTLAVANVQGPEVTLSWTGPHDPEPADLYLLEGGIAPGQVLARLPLGATTRRLTLTLAPGTYYARLHAVRAGMRSAASNEIVVGVGLAAAPTTPSAFQALALGRDVQLSWTTTYGAGPVEQMILDVAGRLSGSVNVPASGPIVFTDVPDGVYVLSIRAANAVGSSPPSAPIRIELPWNPVRPLATPAQSPGAPRLDVRYEDFGAARLALFLQRENLGAVVSGAGSEFDAILRLKDWVAAQWAFSMPEPYPPWDAMTILDWIRGGITGGFCGQYAQVLLQALAAFGIPARYVEIGSIDNPYRHYITEVWSNDHRRWVALDPTFNNHFTRGGIPLSALEVRDALLDGRLDEVDLVVGPVLPGSTSAIEWPQRTAELYYYVRYHLNANHIKAPDEHPFDRFNDMVEWLDGRTPAWEASDVPSEYPHERLTARTTGDRALIQWQPNLVWISSRRAGPLVVTLDLEHSVLNFSHYDYRTIDNLGRPSPWSSTSASSLTWPLAPAQRVVEVRGVNVRGLAGPVSSVQLAMP